MMKVLMINGDERVIPEREIRWRLGEYDMTYPYRRASDLVLEEIPLGKLYQYKLHHIQDGVCLGLLNIPELDVILVVDKPYIGTNLVITEENKRD